MKLYIVTLYNHKVNLRARYAVSNATPEGAQREALGDSGEGWRVSTTQPICETTDDVFTEI
jgi:hypothetical protein